jgi:hypothetical protein
MAKKKGKYPGNTSKSGSKKVKGYDPKTTWGMEGGGGKPSVVGKYSPAGNDTPSFPGKGKKM